MTSTGDGTRPPSPLDERPGPYGRFLAAVFAVVLAIVSVLFAFLSGLWGPPEGSAGAGLIGRGLLVSAVAGVAAVGCAHLALGRGARWRTLTLGLVPAVAEVAWLAVH
jgi:hypothetical protein